jgi:hypothetical protein
MSREPEFIALFLKIMLIATIQIGAITEKVMGFATENFGQHPVVKLSEWPKGIMDVINLETRVYSTCINGNSKFYYRGSIAAINEALTKFATIDCKLHEVIIRPGKTIAKSFKGNDIQFDWQLHVPGGIYLHTAKTEKHTNVYFKHPTITIYVDDNTELKRMQIPLEVKILDLIDLRERYIGGLKSQNPVVRQSTCYELAKIDPYVEYSILPLVGMLNDDDFTVRIQAVISLKTLGTKSYAALPALRSALKDSHSKGFSQACQKAISMIEASDNVNVKRQRILGKQIAEFISALPKTAKN